MEFTIFDIKRFAVHDGPGIRTTLFLKGCPLNCKWCHNPEGISPKKHLWYIPNQCIGCGDCISVCPSRALSMDDRNKIVIDRSRCLNCGKCTETCPARALYFMGQVMTLDEAEEILVRDQAFYEESGGGITISGGEAMRQPKAVQAILKRMKARGIHTALETSLYVSREDLKSVLPLLDYLLADIKLINNEEHLARAGVPNRLILDNIRFLALGNLPMLLRVPLIPGFTDHVENLEGIGDFIQALPRSIPVELMNFNPLGRSKFVMIGRKYEPEGIEHPYREDEMEGFRSLFRRKGLEVK